MNISKLPLRLYASAKAVITLFLTLPGNGRVEHVIRRLEVLDPEEVTELMKNIKLEFGNRHRNIEQIFKNHSRRIEYQYGISLSYFSPEKQLL
jgi:hypothetical protein